MIIFSEEMMNTLDKVVSEEEIIDYILNMAASSSGHYSLAVLIGKRIGINNLQFPTTEEDAMLQVWMDKIYRRINEEGIANIDNAGYKVIPNLLTKIIVDSGGYLQYLQEISENEAQEERRKKIQLENLSVQLKKTKWDYGTRFLPLIVSIVSILISIIALVKSYGV